MQEYAKLSFSLLKTKGFGGYVNGGCLYGTSLQ